MYVIPVLNIRKLIASRPDIFIVLNMLMQWFADADLKAGKDSEYQMSS